MDRPDAKNPYICKEGVIFLAQNENEESILEWPPLKREQEQAWEFTNQSTMIEMLSECNQKHGTLFKMTHDCGTDNLGLIESIVYLVDGDCKNPMEQISERGKSHKCYKQNLVITILGSISVN